MAAGRRIFSSAKARVRFLIVFALIAAILALTSAPAAAQSSGCAEGPFAGATALDSDGDGIGDSAEVLAGTDECNPNSAPSNVCGEVVAGYDPVSTDSDGDGLNDAQEVAGGSDPCDAAAVGATSSGQVAPPRLALTGPTSTAVIAISGFFFVLLGVLVRLIDRRIEL